MDPKFKKILGEGLLSFSADTYKKSERAGFSIEVSDVVNNNGKYHDEWAAHQNGGGQELVETVGGKKWTRVYAGGSLDPEKLTKIGLSEDQVTEKIKFFIGKMGNVSRFDEETNAKEGDWKYSYNLLANLEEISVIVGKEEIRYKGNLVFVHFIINSPVI